MAVTPVPVIFPSLIFAALAVLSAILAVWQFLAACKFPLHRRVATDPAFSPAISILRPLKGCDETTADSLRTWFEQDYHGDVQMLLGAARGDDPVCEIARKLIAQHPGFRAELLICGEDLGANAKVSTLIQLERVAKHDLILMADADVRVPPDFLANLVAPLRDSELALVNCFYRLANPVNAAMQWEAMAVNADFWSQVLQSRMLKPMDFALGAAILMRRTALDGAGGFPALANCLADDYQIGNRIAKNGGKITLCPVVVECWDRPANWHEVWKHQLRWARTIRVCQPAPYFFSILSNASLWPLLWLAATLFGTKTLWPLPVAVFFLLARMVMAQALQRRFAGPGHRLVPAWMAPVKDLLQAAVWASAFCGNKIEWRGRKMRLRPDGQLQA